ncbi:putative oxidoreductase [Gordonia hirsuta DSM 44140 = NBRC 16056]|uniref:Putative oxidoreductase n=1 Tax=Gordonia hirsuta DSM 44140 = NBRC 16056 TaxID=1121927 RepID=L7LCY8_9ACTN|nr:oxidoreductase [Gordonia hirsuta]GAC58784.1 putative oxidoreductase [Gordonia hirsuta DSM 44140 = NBRC 16056]
MGGWGLSDMPSQQGRRVVITGANSGLGEQMAIALGAAGAQVTLACRNVAKAQRVADWIGPHARVAELDLADLASVRAFADGFDGADVLINNAGVMAIPQARTADGFEMQIGTNFLGHFALTGLVLDRIDDRIVTLSSLMHKRARLDVDDLNWQQRKYSRWVAYSDSKLADLVFALDLADRLAKAGSAKASLAAHPGYAATELQGHTETPFEWVMKLGNLTPIAQSAADGALPALFAATSPHAANGEYYGPRSFGEMRGAPAPASYRRAADDPDLRRRLWDKAEELTGVQVTVG